MARRRRARGRSRTGRGRSHPRLPLPATLRSELGAALGADLSAVRIHAGATSSAAARALSARAFAAGSDIHFAAGLYRPDSSDGRQLIAHEIAHTLQAGGRAPGAAGGRC